MLFQKKEREEKVVEQDGSISQQLQRINWALEFLLHTDNLIHCFVVAGSLRCAFLTTCHEWLPMADMSIVVSAAAAEGKGHENHLVSDIVFGVDTRRERRLRRSSGSLHPKQMETLK